MTTIKSKTLKLDYFGNIKAFFNLMKPRVMSLVLFTCAVGYLIAPVKINFTESVAHGHITAVFLSTEKRH